MPTLETHPQTSDILTLETFSEVAEVISAPVETVEEAPIPKAKK
jgi:hypothetical protein